jgi:hypothetical protein
MDRGKTELLSRTVVYFIFLALFIGGLGWFVFDQQNGSSFWSDYYAKEVAMVVNLAEPGDVLELDVQKATKIAFENGVNLETVFEVDNEDKEICVRLSLGRKNCYSYFNDVLVESNLELGRPWNVLKLEFSELGVENE